MPFFTQVEKILSSLISIIKVAFGPWNWFISSHEKACVIITHMLDNNLIVHNFIIIIVKVSSFCYLASICVVFLFFFFFFLNIIDFF